MQMLKLALILTLILPLWAVRPAQAAPVDLELMLLIDSSGSILTVEEWEFQRDSVASAIESPAVTSLLDGTRSVAASVYYWAGDAGNGMGVHEEGVAWTLIETPQQASEFANAIRSNTRPDISTMPRAQTAVSRAINQSVPLFDNNGFEGTFRTIDISGDGMDNVDTDLAINPALISPIVLDLSSVNGPPAIEVPIFGPDSLWGNALMAAQNAAAAGIGINGLALTTGLGDATQLAREAFQGAVFTFTPPNQAATDLITSEANAFLLSEFGDQLVVEVFYQRILLQQALGGPAPVFFVANSAQDFEAAMIAKLSAEIGVIVPEPSPLLLLACITVACAFSRREPNSAS